MKRRAFLNGMLAAGVAPYVAADGPLNPTRNAGSNTFPFVRDIVQLGELATDGPTWVRASRGLQIDWANPGGDYLDANGVVNGPTHYATTVYPPTMGGPWNVTAIVQKMIAEGNTGFYMSCVAQNTPGFASRTSATPPTLQVVTTTDTFNPPCVVNCWALAVSGSTQAGPVIRFPGFLKFDLSGITGTVISATLNVTINSTPSPLSYTFHVDYLKMPALITDPAAQLGGVEQGIAATVDVDSELATHPSVIFYPSFASQAACEAAGWSNLNFARGFPIDPRFITWAEYGIPAMRFSSQYPGYPSDGSSILSWRRNLSGSPTELYCRYLMKVDVDAFVAINELGVKLPGFEGNGFSYRMEHLDQSPSNPQVYGHFLHAYDALNRFATGAAQNRSTGVALRAGRIYSIELRVKQNTINGTVIGSSPDGPVYRTVADGAAEIWIDGVKCYSRLNIVINDVDPAGAILNFFANFYHGGRGRPLAPFHYEFGGVCVATEYIGPPKVIGQLLPAWRQGVAVNEWKEIPNTSIFSAQNATWTQSGVYGVEGPSALITAWQGTMLDPRDSTVYHGPCGGHNAYAGNQMVKLKLSVDAPAWVEAAPPTPGAQVIRDCELYADGRPSARHTYSSAQFIVQRDRAMLFTSLAFYGKSGNTANNIVSFNPNTGLYEADGTYAEMTQFVARPNMPICQDPATGNVYVWRDHHLAKWIQATNTWATHFQWGGNVFVAPQATVGPICVDTRRRRIFYLGGPGVGHGSQGPVTVSLDDAPPVITVLTISGDTSVLFTGLSGCGMVFQEHPTDPAQDCFFVRRHPDSGGRVYRINASTWVLDELRTTGGSSIPDNGSRPFFNRFIGVPQYGGILYMPGGGNVWFLRTQ